MHIDNPYAPPASNVAFTDADLREQAAREPLVYAGFWRRFGAFWLDVIVMSPLFALAYFGAEQSRYFQWYVLLPSLAFGLWFHVYLVSRFGGTPGKLILKTRIAMRDGSPVTRRAAALRYLVEFLLDALSSVALAMAAVSMSDADYFALGYLERSKHVVEFAPHWYSTVNIAMQVWGWGEFVTMLFNKKRRAVHDFMAGTVVIRHGH